jgi:hypothetical protein
MNTACITRSGSGIFAMVIGKIFIFCSYETAVQAVGNGKRPDTSSRIGNFGCSFFEQRFSNEKRGSYSVGNWEERSVTNCHLRVCRLL